MWVIQFNVLRGGERSPEDGSPREFLGQDSPFPLPDIDQTVLHRGEAFVVDDVIWDLERKTVTVELVPPDEAEVAGKPAAAAASADDGDEGSEDLGADGEGDDVGFGEDEGFGEDLDPQSGEPEPGAPPAADKEQPVGQRQRVRGPRPAGPGKAPRRGEAG